MTLGKNPSLEQRRIRPIRFRRYFHELIDYGNGFAGHPAMQPSLDAGPEGAGA